MAKITRQGGKGLCVRLPSYVVEELGLREAQEVDFDLVDKKSVLMKKLEPIGAQELEVLSQLNEIRFAARTKNAVKKKLSPKQQAVLNKLLKKGVVSFYEKGKYKDKGVYSISRDYYYLLSKKQSPPPAQPSTQKGFQVVGDWEKAKNLMSENKKRISGGELYVVRSFDKRFYFVESSIVDSVNANVLDLLEQQSMSLEEISQKLGVETQLLKAVMEVLREQGEVIEKRKEVYSLA
jgi:antitoxin component of MazEF toxin-antitoxin module/biotin operon repressor